MQAEAPLFGVDEAGRAGVTDAASAHRIGASRQFSQEALCRVVRQRHRGWFLCQRLVEEVMKEARMPSTGSA